MIQLEVNSQTKAVVKALNLPREEEICILISSLNGTEIKTYAIAIKRAAHLLPEVWINSLSSFHDVMNVLEDTKHGAEILLDRGNRIDKNLFESSSSKQKFLLAYASARGYLAGRKV